MKRTLQELEDELYGCRPENSWDGENRCVDDFSKVKADGSTWAVINDHGNVELCHKGRNGRIYSHGGLV